MSIALNIAESAAVLDVSVRCKVLTPPIADQHKALLDRIAQMLTKLIKSKRPSTRSPTAPESAPESARGVSGRSTLRKKSSDLHGKNI